MAVTKIWPVRGRLDSLIRYAENEEKTRMPDLTGLAPAKDDLTEVLQYAANHSKTTQDRQLFVSGVNCLPEIARQKMELTKRQFWRHGRHRRISCLPELSARRSHPGRMSCHRGGAGSQALGRPVSGAGCHSPEYRLLP